MALVYGIGFRVSACLRSALLLRLAADAVRDPRDDGQDDRAEEGGHEVVDAESGSEEGRQLEHHGVEDDEKESERDDRQRQSEQDEARPGDGGGQAQDEGGAGK